MRFGLIHRLMTDAIAALGILALAASGELDRTSSLSLLVLLILAVSIPESWQAHPFARRLSSLAPLALLAFAACRLLLGAPLLRASLEFAASLQILRLATRRGAAHDQQVIVLALLHLIAATVVGGGLAYALCFAGFVLVAPAALVLSHLRREVEGNYRQGARDRTGLPVDVPRILRSRRVVDRTFLIAMCSMALPIFLFTAGLFLLFPRIGLSLLLLSTSHPGRMVGFADKVDLGEVGLLRTDPTIALRVEVPGLADPPPRLALHLRGAAFDTYNGRSWSRTISLHDPVLRNSSTVVLRRTPDPVRDRRLEVELDPIDPPALFVPLGAVALRLQHRGDPLLNSKLEVWAGAEGELRYAGAEERGLLYTVYLPSDSEPPERLSTLDTARYLSLPDTLSPRIRDLARSLVRSGVTPFDQARIVEAYLRKDFTYDLNSPSGRAADPLDDFLFVSRRGHCEYYSTAMVVLLRAIGIPARNVTGFVGGTYNRFGRYYAVRHGDAHSWVEANLPGRGWQTFDPTPPSDAAPKSELSGVLALLRDLVEATAQRWDRHVIGYDLHQQVSLFESFSRYSSAIRPARWMHRPSHLWTAAACSLLAAGAALLWRKRRALRLRPGRALTSEHRQTVWATELYETLDAVMATRGISRQAGTPPLSHAIALRRADHPLSSDIVDVTQAYLEARFGGARFTEERQRDLERHVKRIASTPLPTTAAPRP